MNGPGRARRGWLVPVLLVTVLLIAAAVLGATVSALLKGPPVGASWTGWLNGGLESYADSAGQWNSGDNAVQVALPGGRALWLFNDSYYGPVGAGGTVAPDSPLVRNMLLLTSGSGPSFRVTNTITGPISGGVPTAAVPPVAGSPPGAWAWPDGAIVAGHSVQAIYTIFVPQGPGPLDYVPAGNEVVTMPLASLTRPSSYVIQPSGFGPASTTAACTGIGTGCVQWGVGLLDATTCPPRTALPACTYIYGEQWPSPGASSRTLVLAVAPPGHLADQGAWWYDTTSGWSRSPSAPLGLAAPLGRNTSFDAGSVYPLPGGNYLVLGSTGDGAMTAYYAPTPWLSGARAARLFTPPHADGVPGFLAYQFHVEPAYSRGTTLVIGFSVTSFARGRDGLNYAPYDNVAAYQPQFYTVTLPPTLTFTPNAPHPLPAPQLHQFHQPPTPPSHSAPPTSTP
jgi:hypothetical protein